MLHPPAPGKKRVRLLRAATLAVLVVVSGCSVKARAPIAPLPTVTTVDDPALDAARTAFDTSRAALLAADSQLVAGAAALDAQDAAAAKGAYDPVHRGEAAAAAKAAKAASAAGRLGKLLATYAQAVMALGAVRSPELTASQSAALSGLATAGQGEVAALRPLAAGSWTAYRELQGAQGLWTTRAGAGYYPHTNDNLYDPERAGGAYVVLVNPFRSALDAERARLTAASTSLATARAATATALDNARTAFG